MKTTEKILIIFDKYDNDDDKVVVALLLASDMKHRWDV